MADSKFKFGQLKTRIQILKYDLPELLANDARKYFLKSFINQAWEGVPWQEVNRRIPGTPEYKYPKKKDLGRHTRPILIGKGATKLRRAVANSIKVNVFPKVRLVVDLPYADVHNQGLGRMPQRKFMGDSEGLRKIHRARIKKTMDKLWDSKK